MNKFGTFPNAIEMSEEMQQFEELAGSIPSLSAGNRNANKKRRGSGRGRNPQRRYTKQMKIEVVKAAKEKQARRVAEENGIPEGTVKRWVAEYNKQGESAFDPPPIPQLCIPSNWSDTDLKPSMRGNTSTAPVPTPMPQSTEGGGCKLPTNLEGYKKLNFISPQFRLYAVKQGLLHGINEASNSVGISASCLRRWIGAYKACGEDSHIFHVHVKRYCGEFNKGKGVIAFTLEQKKDILAKALRGNFTEVAYSLGMSPDTIGKWRKQLMPRVKKEEGESLLATSAGEVEVIKRGPRRKHVEVVIANANTEGGEEIDGIYLDTDEFFDVPVKRGSLSAE